MLLVRSERPEQRALVHAMAATLLRAERRYSECESEYLKALAELKEAGRGETAETAGVLNMLGDVYLADSRYDDASRALDRAYVLFAAARDTIPLDRIDILNSCAVLHARQGKWQKAEEELRSAIATADRDTRLDPVDVEFLLVNYANVLRKNHRRPEARLIEARAAALHPHGWKDAVVDLRELATK